MDNKEAIEVLKDLRAFDDDCNTDCEALDIAIEALEKQIPKKVNGHWERCNNADYNYKCSVCGGGYTDYLLSYCYDCGTKMDK